MAEASALVIQYESRDGQDIKLTFDTVRKYLVSGRAELVTDQEIMVYMGMCKARGLNPFKKDCYLVKYTAAAPAATIVSIDYFRARARAQPDCRGWEAGVIVIDKEEKIQFRRGSFMYPGDALKGGWFKAKPEGWEVEYEWSVNLEPFIKTTKDGDITKFWVEENQPQQIAKVAESQGLRRCWPDEFQGLYLDGEPTIDMRDVTPPKPEPLKMPEPTKEKPNVKADDAATVNRGSDSGGSNGTLAERRDESVEETQGATPALSPDQHTKPSLEGTHQQKLEAALKEIAGYSTDTFPAPAHLNVYMKGLPQNMQFQITSAFSAKKKELGL